MSYISKYLIKHEYQAPSLEARASQVGQFEGHAIQVVVRYELFEDRYTVEAFVTTTDGIRRKLAMANSYADEIQEAFQIGWAQVDSYFLHR